VVIGKGPYRVLYPAQQQLANRSFHVHRRHRRWHLPRRVGRRLPRFRGGARQALRRGTRLPRRGVRVLLEMRQHLVCDCARKVSVMYWTTVRVIDMCIGRILDDVWTTVVVIGLNSHRNRSEHSRRRWR
jgi:hypothetical protein